MAKRIRFLVGDEASKGLTFLVVTSVLLLLMSMALLKMAWTRLFYDVMQDTAFSGYRTTMFWLFKQCGFHSNNISNNGMFNSVHPIARLREEHRVNHRNCTISEQLSETQRIKTHVELIASRQWKKVLSWIAFHPDEVASMLDHRHQTVLHHACLFRAPSNVIECILFAAPELASIANVDGELAIHWAIRLSVPKEVMTLLLQAYPESGFVRDKDGTTVLSLIWERHQETILDALREGGPEMVQALPSWNMILNLFRNYYDNATDRSGRILHEGLQFRPLHAAAFCPCPPAVFPLLLRVYSKEMQVKDETGHSPLTVAARSPVANRSCDVLTKIDLLLRECPQAARMTNSQGRLPLALAVESRIPWDEGTHSLLQAEPRALYMRDPVTSLYPFMLAAAAAASQADHAAPSESQNVDTCCDKNRKMFGNQRQTAASELTTIYSLLRADPGQMGLFPQDAS